MISFIKQHPFAILTGIGTDFPVATHIPFLIEETEGKLLLHAHMMRKTDHHLAYEKNSNALVIFTGPHTHVSASWYTDPAVGSTWNYMTVHAKGKIQFAKEEHETIAIIKTLTDKYEGTHAASSFNSLSNDYINQMVKAIVGITIEVENMEAVFKLSQNRDEASRKNIIEQLKKRGDGNSLEIAKEMGKLL